MNKKITSIVLAVSMLLSCIAVGSFTAQASITGSAVSAAVDSESVGADYGLADSIQNGQILQCWNWSYNGIKNNMKKIAEQGFTAVQTSPIQTIKESTQGKTMQGSWWVYYQPSNFNIDTSSQNALGTKNDFKAMCDEAHKYGVKVIVDAVLNHMANKGNNTLSDTIPSDIRNDSNCWHSITVNTKNWDSRWDITHNCMDGLPDLNTGNSKIQNYEIKFLKECIDCGADGFRFDGAKHIEVPNDNENAGSNFWTNILGQTTSYAKSTRGITPYYYGEILDKTGGGQNIVNQYTNLMSITCNEVSNAIRNSVNSGDANGAKRSDFCYQDGSQPAGNKAVLWNESHDTYANGSNNQSDTTLKKTWALVGSRAQAVGMYMARPKSNSNTIGTASVTAWGDKEVQAVNQFKNAMTGKTEYLSASGSIVYNERGTEGVVLVNLSGNSTSVNVKANKMANGTYKDAVSGSTFTVSNGQIKGQIGNTGIAVVYNAVPPGPTANVTPGSTNYKTDTLTLTLSYSNATSGQYSIDNSAYQSYTTGKTITIGSGVPYGTTTTVKVKASNGSETSEEKTFTYTKVDPNSVQMLYFDNSSYNWSSVYAYIYLGENVEVAPWPGVQMSKDPSTGYYAVEVPDDFAEGLVIFAENAGSQNRYPADMEPGLPLEGKDKIFVAGNILKDYTDPKPTQPVTQPTPTDPIIGKVLIGDVSGDNRITISDATEIQMHVAHMLTLTGDRAVAADVNMDGSINITDATLIQLYLVYIRNGDNHCGEWYGDDPQPSSQPATDPVTQPETQPTGSHMGFTFLFTDNLNWGTVYVHAWDSGNNPLTGEWPGIQMTESTTNGYGEKQFVIRVPEGAVGVVLSNGNGDQTVDITDFNVTGYYIDGSSDGKRNVKSWIE